MNALLIQIILLSLVHLILATHMSSRVGPRGIFMSSIRRAGKVQIAELFESQQGRPSFFNHPIFISRRLLKDTLLERCGKVHEDSEHLIKFKM